MIILKEYNTSFSYNHILKEYNTLSFSYNHIPSHNIQ
jgi:hypothetical protein